MQHRFVEKLFQVDAGRDLLGFDSAAIINFGTRVGITDRISVYGERSNNFRVIEMGSALQVSRQDNKMPLSLQFRAGMEGQVDFSTMYSGYVQALAERTFL